MAGRGLWLGSNRLGLRGSSLGRGDASQFPCSGIFSGSRNEKTSNVDNIDNDDSLRMQFISNYIQYQYDQIISKSPKLMKPPNFLGDLSAMGLPRVSPQLPQIHRRPMERTGRRVAVGKGSISPVWPQSLACTLNTYMMYVSANNMYIYVE